MNNGYDRRNRKRMSTAKHFKIRYDRIVAALLGLAVLIVVLTSCVKAFSGDDDNKKNDKTSPVTSSETSIVDNLDTSGSSSSSGTSGIVGTTKAEDISYTTEQYLPTDVNQGDLVLVNSAYPYKFPEGDTDLVTIYDHFKSDYYSVCDYVKKLDSNTLAQLDSLMEGFNKETGNTDIVIIGAYRTIEEQNDKYSSGNSGFSGGFSDYHTGRSFDMAVFPKDGSSSGYYAPTGIYSWIDEHAAEYGFIVRFPEGKDSVTGEEARKYTYRYVGAPHASYMKQNNLCLEEYIEQIKTYSNEKPLEVNVGEKLYGIYYVAASTEGNTEVPVPSGLSYKVSGNNADGFIVTVEMN